VVKAAEAEAEAKFLQGQGIARQRQAIIAGLRDSVKVGCFGEGYRKESGERSQDALAQVYCTV
jgi:hypothetical protein